MKLIVLANIVKVFKNSKEDNLSADSMLRFVYHCNLFVLSRCNIANPDKLRNHFDVGQMPGIKKKTTTILKCFAQDVCISIQI